VPRAPEERAVEVRFRLDSESALLSFAAYGSGLWWWICASCPKWSTIVPRIHRQARIHHGNRKPGAAGVTSAAYRDVRDGRDGRGRRRAGHTLTVASKVSLRAGPDVCPVGVAWSSAPGVGWPSRSVPSAPLVALSHDLWTDVLTFRGRDQGFGERRGCQDAPDPPGSPDLPRSSGRSGHQRAHPYGCPHPHRRAREILLPGPPAPGPAPGSRTDGLDPRQASAPGDHGSMAARMVGRQPRRAPAELMWPDLDRRPGKDLGNSGLHGRSGGRGSTGISTKPVSSKIF
jgi:hypothetical protein